MVSGSLFAVAQSAGAAGLSATTQYGMVTIGSLLGALIV